MGIVKDLLLILPLFIIIFKYMHLRKELQSQRKYFIDTLSHDIRVSTIAQIRGLEFLQKNFLIQPCHSELLEEINNSCKYTLDMITMLLNTYKFQNKELSLNYETCNLSELINLAYDNMEKKNINISLLNPKQCLVKIDKNLIQKVINIFLSIALIYGEKNSQILISLKENNNYAEVCIMYYGIKLSEEECKRMQSKSSRFSTVGEGIKMELCKKIIDYHNGDIKVKSYNNNLNALIFSLPVKKKDVSTKGLLLRALCTSKTSV